MLLPQAREERAGRLGVRERFNKVLDVFYHVVVADEEGATLMQAFRDNIQNTLFTVAGLTARLFCEEGHRVAFIQQAQLAFRVAGGARIEIDAAFQQVAMEVRHQRADIALGIRTLSRFVLFLTVLNVLLHALREFDVVAFVDGVGIALLREAHALLA